MGNQIDQFELILWPVIINCVGIYYMLNTCVWLVIFIYLLVEI